MTNTFFQPENIFFGRDGRIKIGDFGVVTEHHAEKEPAQNGIAPSECITHTQGVSTTHYEAPEMNTSKYDEKVDIYALGIILFELITPPFQYNTDRFEQIDILRNTPFPKEFNTNYRLPVSN